MRKCWPWDWNEMVSIISARCILSSRTIISNLKFGMEQLSSRCHMLLLSLAIALLKNLPKWLPEPIASLCMWNDVTVPRSPQLGSVRPVQVAGKDQKQAGLIDGKRSSSDRSMNPGCVSGFLRHEFSEFDSRPVIEQRCPLNGSSCEQMWEEWYYWRLLDLCA